MRQTYDVIVHCLVSCSIVVFFFILYAKKLISEIEKNANADVQFWTN